MNILKQTEKWLTAISALGIFLAVYHATKLWIGIPEENAYFTASMILFLSLFVIEEWFSPLFIEASNSHRPGWKLSFRKALLATILSYACVLIYIFYQRDASIARHFLIIGAISTIIPLTFINYYIPRLFSDITEDPDQTEKRKKRILIWGINYHPEPTGIAPQTKNLATSLKDAGYDVEVLTSFSYYPAWTKKPEDEGRIYRLEFVDGVLVARCWLFVPEQPTTITRIALQLSFLFSSSLRLILTDAPDLYIGISPPFLLGGILRVISKIKGRPYALHLQDFEIEAAQAIKGIKPNLAHKLENIESFAWESSSIISTISPGMLNRLNRKIERYQIGAKSCILSNSPHKYSGEIDPTEVQQTRERYGNKRLLVYSGNLGEKQCLEEIVKTMGSPKLNDLSLVICGKGSRLRSLKAVIEDLDLKNVWLHPTFDDKEHATLLEAADACLISEKLEDGDFLPPAICFPSKTLSYWIHKKPLVVFADKKQEIRHLNDKQPLGIFNENGESIEETLLEFLQSEDLKKMGDQGYDTLKWMASQGTVDSYINAVEAFANQRSAKLKQKKRASPTTLSKLFIEISLKVVCLPFAILIYMFLAANIQTGQKKRKKTNPPTKS